MSPNEIEQIVRERLESWAGKLVAEHATPVLMLGVSHDHKSGQLVLLTTEGMANTELLLLANFAKEVLHERVRQEVRTIKEERR